MTTSKWLVAVAAILVAVLVLLGRSLPAASLSDRAAEPRATAAVVTPTATLAPTAAPAQAAFAPIGTVAPTAAVPPTATARPRVSAGEAERVIRDFFAAVDAKDYARLRELTSGQARQTAEGISLQVRRAEQENNVSLAPHTSRLEVLGSAANGDGTAVRVDFAIEISARAGFLSMPVRATSGEAEFTVENVDGRNTITSIDGNLS